MCAPTSQSPRVSLISIEVKVGFAVRRQVGIWSVTLIEQQGGFLASGEVQFLVVEMVLMLSTPSLRPRRAACPTAPVWHGQSFTNQCAPHILAVDEQRATKPAKITLICTFGSRPARTCHAFKFYRCRIPHQLAQTRRCTFPDLTLCGARRPPGLGSIETDKAYVGSNTTHVYRITINDPDIAGTKATILCCGLRSGRPIERQEARGHPAGSQVRPNLRPLSLVKKQLDTGAFNQNAHDPIRRRRPGSLIDSCPRHIDVSGTSRLRCGRRWRSVRCGLR